MRRILSVLFFCLIGAMAQAQDDKAVLAELGDRVLGDPNAPVTLMEFSSLTCPHCASFHKETLPALKKKYIDTGKVRLVYKDFPLGANAMTAATVARCVPSGRYFKFLDVLFVKQENWAWADNPKPYLRTLAKLASVGEKKFAACIGNKDVEKPILEAVVLGSKRYKVNSTPSFVVNGEKMISGVQPISEFEKVLDDYLDE